MNASPIHPACRFAMLLVAASALSACASKGFGPQYQRPELTLPAPFISENPTPTTRATGNWWEGFGDPVLNSLMTEAMRQSQDLALARARMAEAQATLNQNESNRYPAVDLTAGASRKRSSENSATFSPGSNPVSEDRQLGLSASYEFDFWGKYARADAAAQARLLAQTASQGVALITVQANVAQTYFALRALDAQSTLAQTTLQTRQDNLRLQKLRFDAGVVGALDLRQAESETASALAAQQQVAQARSNTESALALLVGRQPGDIVRPVLARGLELSALLDAHIVPPDLSADLLIRRPDVVAAEQALISANADIGQARAAYFPKISLTANVGQQSRDMSNLFEPASLFWNLLGNLTQPIFRAGAIGAVVAAANAREQQAVAQYTQTVQNAFRDVHDALTQVDTGRAVLATVLLRTSTLRETLRLADLRYKGGYSSYLEVLSTQRDLAQAQSGLIDAQRAQLAAVVSLHKALGGGWEPQRTEIPSVQ
jgi:multidrug efflux system outer membrane protein